MIAGSMVALVTPMDAQGRLDWASLSKLVDFHLENGTHAIVAVGTTGESATLDVNEHIEVIRRVVAQVAGRIPVIAGTGANSTREAIELTAHARKVGAQATLQVAPYYNKPTQEGMYRHFKAIAEEAGLPVILYNVPSRTIADIAGETVLRLAQLPGVVGIKDATGDMYRGSELLARLPQDFAVYSGNDDSALALMAMGAHGVISVTANVAPREMAQMCRAALAGDFHAALAINRRLLPLHGKLYMEANPIPLKWAMARMGLIEGGIRLPLTPLSSAHHDTVLAALKASGVLD